ncbi:hypothetical protein PHLCEN_2v2860 [Hermanssonia centrifuga]|uniref:Uncharacterized protein n=1 Tax=Hermanssonia centrifuga TaxID=98765 RepID=A0A2R6RI58_9APHY|nr:hypothetical protein PHLCEN_2v2860 [Hermanssonia centrifuga]
MSDELATPGAEYTKYSDMFSSATSYSAAVQDAWVGRSERDGLSLPVHSARIEYSLEEPQWHQSPLNVSINYQQSLECHSVSQWLSQIQKQTPPASMASEASGSRHTSQALPPSVFTQSSLTAVKLPDLQHPRPRRAYVPSWQKETEFDVRQFVSANPGPGSSVCDALPIIEDGVSEASEEDYMDEEWEFDDDNEEDEVMEDVPVDVAYGGSSQPSSWTAHASFRGDEVRQNTSFSSGSRTSLDSTSLLFQPVSDSVRYPQPCVIPESATYDGPFHPYYLGSAL